MSKSYFFNPKAMRPLCSGPLTQWLDSFAERLVQQGYSDLVCRRKTRLVAELSRWLGQQRLSASKLNEQRVSAPSEDAPLRCRPFAPAHV